MTDEGGGRETRGRAALRLVVTGRVQGVGYRVGCSDAARRLGVDGFVANLADGRVEVVAAGAPEAVEALADWCGSGPAGAAVDRVERAGLAEKDAPPAGSGFAVARRAVGSC